MLRSHPVVQEELLPLRELLPGPVFPPDAYQGRDFLTREGKQLVMFIPSLSGSSYALTFS